MIGTIANMESYRFDSLRFNNYSYILTFSKNIKYNRRLSML